MTATDLNQPGWRLRFWPRRREPSPESLLPALPPYHSVDRHRVRRATALVFMMLFCFLYGFFFSAFLPAFFAFFMFPLIVLLFLVIWALPDLNWAPTRTLEWLFYATLIALIAWPDYLAIALPGLPWITLLRLTSFPLVLTLLICISMSGDFRDELKRSLAAVPAIPILLSIFCVIQLYSIGLSHDISSSIQKFIVAQTTWTAAFFAAAYVFTRPGKMTKWAAMLWALAVFVSVIAIWEYRIGRLPWAGHIPSFLKIEDESVQRILAGSMRAGTDRYRSQATFGTPLGLAEYNALALPFVMHFATKRFAPKIRVAALLSIPLIIFADYLTDAKLGTIGCLLAVLLYIFAVSFNSWKRNKSSLIAASFVYSYAIGLLVVALAVEFVPRLHVMILGGSSHSASTDARIAQYTTGFQKFLEWPFGYGVGQGAETLGFTSEENGMITIDTYYLSILLEYGLVGFIVYYGMFAIAIYEGARRCIFAQIDDEDRSFLVPTTISLVCFIVIKSVFSQQDNHPVVFMMLGAIVALAASRRKKVVDSREGRSRNPQRNAPTKQLSIGSVPLPVHR